MPVGRGPVRVNAAHDFFGGGDRIGDDGFVRRAGLELELGESSGGENGGGNDQDSFAAFVHGKEDISFALSSPSNWRRQGDSRAEDGDKRRASRRRHPRSE